MKTLDKMKHRLFLTVLSILLIIMAMIDHRQCQLPLVINTWPLPHATIAG